MSNMNKIHARNKIRRYNSYSSGFTIVELLIVVVVIAILAAIAIVAYSGIQARAEEAKLKSDLSNSVKQLDIDNTTSGRYPINKEAANNNKGLPTSTGITYVYTYISADNSYCLTGYSSKASIPSYYLSSSDTTLKEGTCPGHPASAPVASAGSIETVHGNTAPGVFDSYSDAQVSKWVVHQYYVPIAGPSLETARIIGARLYIPAGSPHIGQPWRAVLIIRTGQDAIITYQQATINPGGYAQFEGSDTLVEGAPLVAGWNEVLYPQEYPGVDNNEAFLVGTQIGDGTRYVANGTLQPSYIPATGGANFGLAEVGSASGDVVRAFYDGNRSNPSLRSYGIDVMVKVP